jgi:hypothetical protein
LAASNYGNYGIPVVVRSTREGESGEGMKGVGKEMKRKEVAMLLRNIEP